MPDIVSRDTWLAARKALLVKEKAIPGARLALLEGAGHELPRPVWDIAIPQILAISRPR